MSKATIIVGLGFGDEGKGATVDYLTHNGKVPLVVKYSGGCQSQHNVVTPIGQTFCYSQFGACDGGDTFIGKEFIFDPLALIHEQHALGYRAGALTIDPRALVVTPYHVDAGVIVEKVNKHGSTGRGIGACRSYALQHPDDALRAGDLVDIDTIVGKLTKYLDRVAGVYNAGSIQYTADRLYMSIGHFVTNMWKDFYYGCDVVFEGGQGVLIDEKYGFHPHTTWSNVMPHVALEMCNEAGITDVETLGITRCYHTRHGNGPFPCYPLPNVSDPNNPEGMYQGAMRFGQLNLSLLNYAIKCCEVSGCPIDALAVNGLDQIGPAYYATTLIDDFLSARQDITLAEQSIVTQLLNGNLHYKQEEFTRLELLNRLAGMKPVNIIADGPMCTNRTEM